MCNNSKNALLTETTWRTTALLDVVCICLRRDHESYSTNPLFRCYQTYVLDLKDISIKYLTPSLFKVLFDCNKDSWSWSENVLLPFATKLRQGNIFTGVCQSFCSQGGVCLSACWDTHPPGRYTLRAGTPPSPRQVHPPAGTSSGQVHTPGRCTPPGAGTLPSPRAGTPPPMVTAADGTHPTGMLSCEAKVFTKWMNLMRHETLASQFLLRELELFSYWNPSCLPLWCMELGQRLLQLYAVWCDFD